MCPCILAVVLQFLVVLDLVSVGCSGDRGVQCCVAVPSALLSCDPSALSMYLVVEHAQQHHLVTQPTRNQPFTVYQQPTYAPLQGIGSGIASSLPLLVLLSMHQQRRILMRMH